MDEQVLSESLETAYKPEAQPAAEKMLTEHQVNKVVAREKEAVANKVRRELEEEHQRQLAEIRGKQSQRNDEVPRDYDVNAMYQQVQERFNKEMQERQLQQEMTQVANNYLSRVDQGRKNYQDFDEITKEFDPTAFPQLIYLVAGLENAGDIIYDLSKNPNKLVTLDTLAQKNPRQAQAELQRLSQSINANKEAATAAEDHNVNQPLDQLQPSRVSAGNGKQTISDLRNQPWLAG